ncbi:thiol-disulfide isomerase/thioredoxin [Microbacterium resistens]|uniref:Thiol-disulfide isomerase/thioredoxin n=1 Tax=Microbacterium resistens TaxID=156977 RepID=A0ABU1SGD4_9MICO|nr:thioredoxin family protein [Microbacterium resistens]MDR6868666.1 thiol-disulfide isomerase/thioredoxin [Microbacterium resistens]
MSVTVALAAVAALLAATVVLGVLLKSREGGRRRGAKRGAELRLAPADLAPAALAERATLVQFSTEFCARCPQVRRVLGAWADARDGVAHAEIDLTHRRDLAARYGVLSTPTTLLVDGDGVIRARFLGVPRLDAVADALAELPGPSINA